MGGDSVPRAPGVKKLLSSLDYSAELSVGGSSEAPNGKLSGNCPSGSEISAHPCVYLNVKL